MNKLTKQILKFLVVGGTAFLIDFSIYYILTELVAVHYLIAGIVAFIISLIFNYTMSIKWVFDIKKEQTIKEQSLFIILSVMGLGINQFMLYVLVEGVVIHHILAKLIATFVVMVFNFVTRKWLIEKC